MNTMGMYSADMMSRQTSTGSMDASASYTHFACADTAFRCVVILDAILLASIFVAHFLVNLEGLANALVLILVVLAQLAVLLAFRRSRPKR